MSHNPQAKCLAVEHQEDVRQSGLGLIKQGQQGIAQNVFHAHAPGVGPHLLEHIDEPGGDQRPKPCTNVQQRIVTKWLRRVRDVEVDHFRLSVVRNGRCDALHQIAMGIDQSAAPARLDVLPDQGFEQRGFAGAGLADDVDVRKPVTLPNAKQAVRLPQIGASEK